MGADCSRESMSTTNSDTVPAGAYILRNKRSATVVHLQSTPNNAATDNSVVAHTQAEEQFRDQQVWWIEGVPDGTLPGEPSSSTVRYTITSLASGRSLALASNSKGLGVHIKGSEASGAPWQQWIFRKIEDDDGVYYQITSAYSQKALDIVGKNSGSGAVCHTWDAHCNYDQQKWELALPSVGVPAGWVTLRNAASGHLLDHGYLTSPPRAWSPPKSPTPSYDRASWGAQWCLIRPPATEKDEKTTALRTAWVLRNRLTGGFLARADHEGGGVCAWATQVLPDDFQEWKLDASPSGDWKVVNVRSGCVLEQPDALSPLVTCREKKFRMQDVGKRWTIGRVATTEGLPAYEEVSK